MRLTVSLLLVALALGGCMSTVPDDDAAAATDVGGKTDVASEVVLGQYTNANPSAGELVTLSLTAAEPSELPEAYYEGRYALTERTENGDRTSSGFFNVYAYANRKWIRFVDEASGGQGASFEKYSWVYSGDTLAMVGNGSDNEFYLDLPLVGTQIDCTVTELLDDGVFEEGLSIDEYPDVSVSRRRDGQPTIHIGSWSLGTDAEDRTELAMRLVDGTLIATATAYVGDDGHYEVIAPANGTGRGRVISVEDDVTTEVANLDCTGATNPLPSFVTCDFRRLSVAPQGEGVVSVTIESTDDAGQQSDALDAWEGNYDISINAVEGGIDVFLFENNWVLDEAGSFSCAFEGAESDGTFCREPIELDKNLGTDADEEEIVHAFDIACRLETL